MIAITLYQFMFLYTSMLLAAAIGLWLWTELGLHRRREELVNQFRWRCTFCRFLYLDDANDRLSRCPQCGSINMPPDAEPIVAPVDDDAPKPRRNPSRKKGRSMGR